VAKVEDDIKELEVAGGHLWAHMGPRKLIPDLVNIQKTDGKITLLLIGKSTISMTIFNSYVKLPEGIWSQDVTSVT
jgi:hypothetical protein